MAALGKGTEQKKAEKAAGKEEKRWQLGKKLEMR